MNPIDPIEEAMGHLGAALMQTIAQDDQIIMDHVREAHKLVQAAYRAQQQQQRDEHRYQAAE